MKPVYLDECHRFSLRRLIWLWGLGSLVGLAPVAAQSGVVSGTVSEARTGRPVGDAVVAVQGTAIQTRTDGRGQFRIAELTGSTVTLRIVRVGYQPLVQSVPVPSSNATFTLTETVLKLDELIVTGQAGETQKRALGNVVGNVDLAATQRVAPTAKLQEALSVAVPGLQLQRASGQVGTGGVTRVRGISSLSLSAEPIVFIDGVRADNTSGSNSIGFQSGDRPSRMNDINPDEIESIQVLKGPSAATLYGTEASNGVIQIITKRGAPGRPTWNVDFRAGANWLPSPEKVYEGVYYRPVGDPNGPVQRLNLIENDIRRGFGSPFSTGTPLGGTASISGGTDAIRYFFSGSFDRDEGIVDYNWQNKLNATANLTYSSSDKFKIDLNLGFVRSKTRSASATQPVTTYIVWACAAGFCPDGSGLGPNDPGRGYLSGVTPEAFEEIEGFDEIDRARAGLTFTHRPIRWLTHRLTLGGDFTGNQSSDYFPRGSNPAFGFANGIKLIGNDRTAFVTVDYSATGSVDLGKNFNAQTSGGVQYYRKQFDQFTSQGEGFPIRGVNTVSGGGVRQGFEDPNFNFENKTLGVYVQEQFSWRNRLFLTGAVRGDDNSAFGTNFDFVVYPKVSASWVLSEEPFFSKSAFLSALKLRAAVGKAGQQPNAFAAVRTYGPSVGTGGTPTVTPLNVGNPDLKPEVTREIEGGFDASLFNDRMSVEVTYYNKVTRDGILSRLVSPSSGFPGQQFINVGQFSNKGVELALDGTIIQSKDFRLNLRGTLATNKNKIDDLGQDTPIPNTLIGGFVSAYNVSGFPIGSFFTKRVVSATLVSRGEVTDVLCEGGTNFGRGNGTTIPCGNAPLIFYGQPIPTWLSSISADVSWRRFRLVGVAEFQGGHWMNNGDIAASHFFFNNSKASAEGTDPILEAYKTAVSDQAFAGTGLMKAGFGKIRNISLSYDFPKRVAGLFGAGGGSVTMTAANLFTVWRAQEGTFGLRAVDPEIRANATAYYQDANSSNGYNQESWPQFARFMATIRLSY